MGKRKKSRKKGFQAPASTPQPKKVEKSFGEDMKAVAGKVGKGLKTACIATGHFFKDVVWGKGLKVAGLAIAGLFKKKEASAKAGKPAKKSYSLDEDVRKRFPGVTSLRELSILAKNSASGADKAYLETQELNVQLADVTSKIASLRTPKDADEATAQSLSDQRAALRTERDEMARKLAITESNGRSLETAADEYAYLYKLYTGNEVNYRTTPRFGEPNIQISTKEAKALIKCLQGDDRSNAARNLAVASLAAIGAFFALKVWPAIKKAAKAVWAFIVANWKAWWFIAAVVVILACAIVLPITLGHHDKPVVPSVTVIDEPSVVIDEAAQKAAEEKAAAEKAAAEKAAAEKAAAEAAAKAEAEAKAKAEAEAKAKAEAEAKAYADAVAAFKPFEKVYTFEGNELRVSAKAGQAKIYYPASYVTKNDIYKASESAVAMFGDKVKNIVFSFEEEGVLVLTYPEAWGEEGYQIVSKLLTEDMPEYIMARVAELKAEYAKAAAEAAAKAEAEAKAAAEAAAKAEAEAKAALEAEAEAKRKAAEEAAAVARAAEEAAKKAAEEAAKAAAEAAAKAAAEAKAAEEAAKKAAEEAARKAAEEAAAAKKREEALALAKLAEEEREREKKYAQPNAISFGITPYVIDSNTSYCSVVDAEYTHRIGKYFKLGFGGEVLSEKLERKTAYNAAGFAVLAGDYHVGGEFLIGCEFGIGTMYSKLTSDWTTIIRAGAEVDYKLDANFSLGLKTWIHYDIDARDGKIAPASLVVKYEF